MPYNDRLGSDNDILNFRLGLLGTPYSFVSLTQEAAFVLEPLAVSTVKYSITLTYGRVLACIHSVMAASANRINFTVYKGSSDRRVVQGTTHRDRLYGDEALLRITHGSLCGTDEHYLNVDMCLGHEGAGVVEELGPDVKSLQV